MLRRTILLFFLIILSAYAQEGVTTPANRHGIRSLELPPVIHEAKTVRIAVLGSGKVIGKYSQSIYNVALATLLGRKIDAFELKRYDLPDESSESIRTVLDQIRSDRMEGILAPLTANGVRSLLELQPYETLFIPTVHRRDFPSAPDNVTFGAIDYESQIEALIPHMSDSIAVFYDSSPVGERLKTHTESLFLAFNNGKRKALSYPVDVKGDKIVSYLATPSAFSKKSVVMHIPVVKSSLLAAHLTFTGARERNILSTQINVDPSLISLTLPADRNNMILANSLVEFPPSIYETNDLMGNDLRFDWVLYTSSVGIDYLAAQLGGFQRDYTMRIVRSQVVYPIELLTPKEFGFEPYKR